METYIEVDGALLQGLQLLILTRHIVAKPLQYRTEQGGIDRITVSKTVASPILLLVILWVHCTRQWDCIEGNLWLERNNIIATTRQALSHHGWFHCKKKCFIRGRPLSSCLNCEKLISQILTSDSRGMTMVSLLKRTMTKAFSFCRLVLYSGFTPWKRNQCQGTLKT